MTVREDMDLEEKDVTTDRRSNVIDAHVGARIRLRRTLLGMSQDKLGQAIGLTFQQVQKYERGANRIGAGRLFEIAQVLDVPVAFFFDDMPTDVAATGPGETYRAGAAAAHEANPLMRRETLELVRAYYGIHDTLVRQQLRDLVKGVASSEEQLEKLS